jgi:hypothetical protein
LDEQVGSAIVRRERGAKIQIREQERCELTIGSSAKKVVESPWVPFHRERADHEFRVGIRESSEAGWPENGQVPQECGNLQGRFVGEFCEEQHAVAHGSEQVGGNGVLPRKQLKIITRASRITLSARQIVDAKPAMR